MDSDTFAVKLRMLNPSPTERMQAALRVIYTKRILDMPRGELLRPSDLKNLELDISSFDLSKNTDAERFAARCSYWLIQARVFDAQGRKL